MKQKTIVEAPAREVATKREKVLKKKLIALLRDDGKGHKHAKFADRLEDFIVKIVSSEEFPEKTAEISFEEVTIYISDGFLKDPDTFYQLNVLMRHELAHYLMQHQIRMMHKIIEKYGEDGYTRISMSHSLHRLLNIIEDFEISNTRYTDADKIIIKNLVLNGETISGLITEQIRGGWAKMSVLEMYEALVEEIESIQQSILARWQVLDLNDIGDNNDYMHVNIKNALYYADVKAPTNFFAGGIEQFLKNRALYHFFPFDRRLGNGQILPCVVKYSSLPDVYQNIIKDIFEAIQAGYKDTNGNSMYYTKQMVRDFIETIAKTSIMEVISLKIPNTNTEFIKLYTPEEKLIAVDTLKALLPTLELRKTWYDKVMKVMGDESKYSIDDLEAALEMLED
jgi:hypothetical protein